MAPLRASAPCFQPGSWGFGNPPDCQGSGVGTVNLIEMYRPFFNPHVQNYVRDGCLTAAPWLWATGLPGDTLGLLTVCRYHQDVCLEKQQLEEVLEQERAQAEEAAELQKSMLRDQRQEMHRLVAKASQQAAAVASLQQQLGAAHEARVQEQEAHGVTQAVLASSREETSHLQAERECLSACLEDQEKEIVQLSHAAERATEAATANIHNMRAEAEEATLAHAQEAAGLKQQLADAKSAMAHSQQQAAQQMAAFQAHVYETLGQYRAQHHSQSDRLTDELAQQHQEMTRMAVSAETASRAAEAAAHVAEAHITALEAAAEQRDAQLVRMQLEIEAHTQEKAVLAASKEAAQDIAAAAAQAADARAADLAIMQQTAEGQRDQLAALQILVACQGLGAASSRLHSRRRLASLFQDIAALKARSPVPTGQTAEPQTHRHAHPAPSPALKEITNYHSADTTAEQIPGFQERAPLAAARSTRRHNPPQHKSLYPEAHSSSSTACRSSRPSRKLKRDAEDAAKVAQLSQDLQWGYTVQLPKRLQRKVTAQLHREWD
ncbi:hypothetical protein WJX74_008232 [Apatococcus lobatus]|uniref:Uncharacterized protein n=1 Tax=Apatococcus lobatus TaxID=904363 RepID=A0AAW1SF36_9CHLO